MPNHFFQFQFVIFQAMSLILWACSIFFPIKRHLMNTFKTLLFKHMLWDGIEIFPTWKNATTIIHHCCHSLFRHLSTFCLFPAGQYFAYKQGKSFPCMCYAISQSLTLTHHIFLTCGWTSLCYWTSPIIWPSTVMSTCFQTFLNMFSTMSIRVHATMRVVFEI